MERNEPLVVAASYFWSDALNAFLFGHRPMTPTLADVVLLTGLDISSPDTPFRLIAATSHRLDTRGIGGWKDDPIFELPSCFDSTTGRFDEDLTDELIKLGILPANFFSGKDAPTYEFYNPSVVARQFGMGQLPIQAYFVGQAKFRDELTKDLNDWIVAPFAVQQFKLWWAEWKQYLFCASVSTYCNLLDPTNIDPNAESKNRVPPTHSRSGRPIEDHHPYTIFPLIGYDTPSVDVIAGRSKQARKKVTKKTSRRLRTRVESADPPMITSAETLAALPLPAAGEADTQVITQAGAAAASLLVEAMQVNLMSHPADCHPHTDSSYFRLHKSLL
uniref:Aminotransferase-like plant mobile domain-containing protein n=1 Tax=Setaria viridis TaxID=4556 RepID=A0A4U6VFE0_SETVI|nr:hypothetical protein SEVIR_3G304600v2 [Setaria viridis]